jgi:hypothetical protein
MLVKVHKQQGAALVLAIVIASVGVMAWQQRASLSQLIMAQHVLEQSTAAASLAAAQHHARLLNSHAFLNRTIMAHQVAMAHLMTIASAEKMRLEMSRRVMRGNPPLYLIGMMFGAHHAAAYAASKMGVAGSTLSGVNQLHEAFKRHDQTLMRDLREARQQLLDSIEPTTHDIVQQVLQRNMSRYSGQSIDLNVKTELASSRLRPKSVKPSSEVWRSWFKQTLEQHPYLQNRRDTARNWWVIKKECPHLRHELRRRGESSMDVDGLWQVTDTLSFHAVRGYKVVFCFWREYPMGFSNVKSRLNGRSAVSQYDSTYERPGAAPEDFRKMTFLRWFTAQYAITSMFHGFNNLLADGWGYRSQLRWVAHSRSHAYVLEHTEDLIVRVTVSQQLASLQNPILKLGLRLKGLLQIRSDWGDSLNASSAAQVYFDRYERRSDGRRERANLFQPFWMAKNVLLQQ